MLSPYVERKEGYNIQHMFSRLVLLLMMRFTAVGMREALGARVFPNVCIAEKC